VTADVSRAPAVDLLVATSELVAIPSVSHDEHAIADHIEGRLRAVSHLAVDRLGDNIVARTTLGRPSRLILAGHTDTVPGNGNAAPRVDGDTLWGLGSADMKSGLAVMIELALTVRRPAVDVTYVFYVCEEVARQHNGLLHLFEARPDLLAGEVAILGEPTGGRVEAGCQGVLKLMATVRGRRAHTARPWMGANAIHRLGRVLDAIAGYQDRRPVIDGCQYREALQAVAVAGGVAGNVVPDLATVSINHRFAPDRDPVSAEAAVGDVLAPALDAGLGDTLEVIERSPAAAPELRHPLLARLVEASGAPPRAKLGWTDVASFAERGIPATNFGPGDPELAHTADERVQRAEVEATYGVLAALLG
jgi:succinyl-diaminopimelate desuccinylase